MYRTLTLLAAFAYVLSGAAQPVLLPTIGIGALPSDNDPVCTLPTQTPPIQNVGRPAGENAADFTLYDLNGNTFNLHDALLLGKPVLMISASYTCPVFRGKIPGINDVVATFGDQLTTVIVYTVEAHPYLDISPYFGAVNTSAQNISAGILYEQPTTYGERKAVLQDLLDSLLIDAPTYIDGPCNEWWNYYGPQPNNAYLIDTTGVIFAHHDWFDKVPDDIYCDIDSLLGLPTNCNPVFGGQFNLQMVSNDTIYGQAGSTITGQAKMWNPSNVDCLVRVVKLQVSLPAGWQTSLCMDVCYLPDIDTAVVEIPAGDTLHFYYYFYTTPGAGTGYSRIGFRNVNDNTNNFNRNFWGISQEPNALNELVPEANWSVSPNPVTDEFRLIGDRAFDLVRIMDVSGREAMRAKGPLITIADLQPGLYLVQPLWRGAPIGGSVRIVKR